jgi:hypothetical protein
LKISYGAYASLAERGDMVPVFCWIQRGVAILTKCKRLNSNIDAMIRLAKLQFLGPAAVLIAVGAAEVVAFALAHIPTSETLWYINLKIFQVFQESSFTLQPPLDLPYSQFFLIALPLFAIATYGLLTKRSFPLALASHLSFIYAGFLIYCLVSSQTQPLTASVTNFAFTNSPNIYLPLFLAGACIISFLISHYQYLLGFFNTHSKSMPRADNP